MSYQRFVMLSGVALALVMGACGGAPLNQAKLAQAQAAMHAAETLGAANDPKAKQSLDLARQQIDKAQRLARDGEGEEANLYLSRATADADLASQLMRTQSAQQKAREAVAKARALAGNTPGSNAPEGTAPAPQ
jgi:uncharacterized membrane protein